MSFFFDDFAIYNAGDSGALSSELVSHAVLDLLLTFSSSLLFSSGNISLNLRFSQMHFRELHNPSILASVIGLDTNFLKKGWFCKFSVASFGFSSTCFSTRIQMKHRYKEELKRSPSSRNALKNADSDNTYFFTCCKASLTSPKMIYTKKYMSLFK